MAIFLLHCIKSYEQFYKAVKIGYILHHFLYNTHQHGSIIPGPVLKQCAASTILIFHYYSDFLLQSDKCDIVMVLND